MSIEAVPAAGMHTTVGEIMTRRPVVAQASATARHALDAMKERGISSVLVLPPPGSTEYGIVTMRDIVGKVVKNDLDPDAVRLGDIMTWRLVTTTPQSTLVEAAATMASANVRRLPVVEGGEIVGLVSDTDVFTALVPRQEWEHARGVRKERALQRASRHGAEVHAVSDLMSAPVITIGPAATVREAVEKMVAVGISSLLVGANGDGPQGIVTKRDIVTKVVALERDSATTTVSEIMSAPVRTIGPEATIEECSARMAAEAVRRFPVTRGTEIVGVISDTDILTAVIAQRWRGHPGHKWPTAHVVADVMSRPPGPMSAAGVEWVPPELSLWDAAARMAETGARRLPVVQAGEVIGIISDTDILRGLEQRGGGD